MNKLTNWIKSHQVAAFFIITFAITWGLGFSWVAVMNKGIFLLAPLAFLAACGPALAGIIISAVTNTQPKQGSSRTTRIAFLAAWVASTLVFVAHNRYFNLAPFSPVLIGFTFITVAPVVFVISMAYSRIPAVKSYLGSLIRLRGAWACALLALVFFPVLALLAIFAGSLIKEQPIVLPQFRASGLALAGLVAVKFLYQFFFFNATGEEAGWRGFAFPRLQSLTSPLVACLVINLFWPLWHLFLWMAEGRPVFVLEFWIRSYLELLPGTVILGWFYNRSKGSILIAGIAHAAANTTFAFFPGLDWTVYTLTAATAALVMILVDRMWKKLPPNDPAVYCEPALEGNRSRAGVTHLAQENI